MDFSTFADIVRPFWLVWLVILFAGVVYWAFRPKNKRRFEKDSMIPFRDENGG